MLGTVGQDSFGETLNESLNSAGVDTSLMKYSYTATGLAVICVDKLANNSIVVIPGANKHTDVQYIRQNSDAIADSKVILLQMEIPHEAVYESIRIAHKNKRTVVLNPAPAPEHITDDILPMIDYLIPNETELESLTGISVSDEVSATKAGRALISRGVKHVIATLGSRGALFISDGIQELFPAHAVEAVDTTAAGDSFNAAFAIELANDRDFRESLIFASAAAAISVTRSGAQTSISTRDEVTKIIREGILP